MLFSVFAVEMVKVIPILIVFFLFCIAFRVLFMLSIGYDCKAQKNPERSMWMILCFLSPLIAGIIYACGGRKETVTPKRVCDRCGADVEQFVNYCRFCGNSNFLYAVNTDYEKNKKTSKILFAFSVAAYIAAIISELTFVVVLFISIGNSIHDLYDILTSIVS